MARRATVPQSHGTELRHRHSGVEVGPAAQPNLASEAPGPRRLARNACGLLAGANLRLSPLFRAGLVAVLLLAAGSGCSVRRFAVNQIGDAIASSPSVYENDEDIELVGGSLPFGLKLIEGLLQESPKHRGMLLTACQGFVLYSYGYVDYEAEVAAEQNVDRARELRVRARRLYLRAFRFGIRGLELSYEDFGDRLAVDPLAAVRVVSNKKTKRKDVDFLYWTAAALGLAVSVSRNEAAMLARLPEVEALVDRAMQLDEAWDNGALHAFQVQLAGTKPGETDYDAIKRHFERALQLSEGHNASLYLAYLEAVSIPQQNRAEFLSLVDKALAVDPDRQPDQRLVTLLAHRRARWLREHVDDLILEEEPARSAGGDE